MLTLVIVKLIEEEIPTSMFEKMNDVPSRKDSDVTAYFNSCKISKMFNMLLSERHQCGTDHENSRKAVSLGLNLHHSEGLQLDTMLQNHFSIKKMNPKCSECYSQLVIESLPEVLLLVVDRFNQRGKLSHPDLKIPKKIDMKQHFEKNDVRTKYELIAIVSSKGEKIQNSDYHTVVRRAVIGERHK